MVLPLVAAAGISAAGSLLGGLLGSNGTKKAAEIQAQSNAQALAAQQAAGQEVKALNAGGVQAYNDSLSALSTRAGLPGGGAANDVSALSPGSYGDLSNPTLNTPTAPALLSTSAADFTNSPDYQFLLDRGTGAINSNFAARGALNSGAAMKGIANFATGLASTKLNDWRNFNQAQNAQTLGQFNADRTYGADRYDTDRSYLTDQYNQQTGDLLDVNNIGRSALQTTSNVIGGIGKAGADAALNTGNAQAGSALQNANIWSNAVNNVAGIGAGLIGQPLTTGGMARGIIASNPNLF